MYFLFSKLRGWGKRPAIRPQTHLCGVALRLLPQIVQNAKEQTSDSAKLPMSCCDFFCRLSRQTRPPSARGAPKKSQEPPAQKQKAGPVFVPVNRDIPPGRLRIQRQERPAKSFPLSESSKSREIPNGFPAFETADRGIIRCSAPGVFGPPGSVSSPAAFPGIRRQSWQGSGHTP